MSGIDGWFVPNWCDDAVALIMDGVAPADTPIDGSRNTVE